MFKSKKKAERNNIFSQPLIIIHIRNVLVRPRMEDCGRDHQSLSRIQR